jgi:RNA polymerase sigma-70 factor (ECF subfamily)
METRYGIESQGAPLDEPSLVDRARHDPDAFGELYERYCDRIYRYARARLKGRVDAEDLTAEVFFRALRGIETYRNAGRPFGAWLYRIEVNTLAERSRRQRTTVSLNDVADLPDYHRDVVDHVLHRERMRSIWTAVRGLTPQQRRAITLRFAADLPMRTIAQVMQKSPDAVKLLVSRGVRQLREQLATRTF